MLHIPLGCLRCISHLINYLGAFLICKASLCSCPTLDLPKQTQLTECWPGAPCLNVVDIEMGGTTAREFHCSGSWPSWMACVAKCWKLGRKPCGETSLLCMLSCEGRRQEKSEEDKTRKPVREGWKETRESQSVGSKRNGVEPEASTQKADSAILWRTLSVGWGSCVHRGAEPARPNERKKIPTRSPLLIG